MLGMTVMGTRTSMGQYCVEKGERIMIMSRLYLATSDRLTLLRPAPDVAKGEGLAGALQPMTGKGEKEMGAPSRDNDGSDAPPEGKRRSESPHLDEANEGSLDGTERRAMGLGPSKEEDTAVGAPRGAGGDPEGSHVRSLKMLASTNPAFSVIQDQ